MPAPRDPHHSHRAPGLTLLGLVLLTALALAAATIHWTNGHTTRRDSIADPDFIAWAVSDTERAVDGFTLTGLELWRNRLIVSGETVERTYTLQGLTNDSRGDGDPPHFAHPESR